MDQYEKVERRKKHTNSTKLSSISDIDQLCKIIDESTFGLKTFSLSTKFSSIPSYQIKAFSSSRLKRLHSSKSNIIDNNNTNNSPSTFSMRLSISSSLLNKFRSLSTYNLPQTRRYSSPRITLFRTKSVLPSINEDDMNSLSTTQSQLSCTIVDTRRTNPNSCNVEELAAYLDNFLYLPKSLSGAAELMYT